MLSRLSDDDARCLRDVFLASDYCAEGVSRRLGTLDPPALDASVREPLLDRVGEADAFGDLARLFFFGRPVAYRDARDRLGARFVDVGLACGLLGRDADRLEGGALVVPSGTLLVASDPYARLRSDHSDHVLAVNPVARHLLNFTLRNPVEHCLDLCAGNGIQALAASGHSRHVVATDLNERALQFARFNARLNGVDNLECIGGDGFAPVAGRRFDLIVCNPPFVLTPTSRFLYRDNPMELDLFSRRLTGEAPAHLEPGGHFQIICEWVQVEGQSWEERLAEWFAGSGCDAWVLKANTLRPESYAERRIAETAALESAAGATPKLPEWLAYYRERRVEAIHGGLIALRRRSGSNWIRFDAIQARIDAPFGQAIARGFDARDFLAQHADDEVLLGARLRLAEDARLEKDSVWAGGQWQTDARVRLGSLQRTIGVETTIADFLTRFDGRRNLAELVAGLPPELGVERESVLGVVRALLENGVLCPDPLRLPS